MENTLALFSKENGLDAKSYEKLQKFAKLRFKAFGKRTSLFDYHIKAKSHTQVYSFAVTLFVKAATESQAALVAKKLKKEFLLDGGFVTTLTESSHQWDMPNGWAPLQWITIKGLLNYGYKELAFEGAKRFIKLNESLYKEMGTILEKVNVRDYTANVSRGEYKLQQGFGGQTAFYLSLRKSFSRPSFRKIKVNPLCSPIPNGCANRFAIGINCFNHKCQSSYC